MSPTVGVDFFLTRVYHLVRKNIPPGEKEKTIRWERVWVRVYHLIRDICHFLYTVRNVQFQIYTQKRKICIFCVQCKENLHPTEFQFFYQMQMVVWQRIFLSFENSVSIYYTGANDLQRYFPIYKVIWEISHFSPMQFNWALVSEIFMILQ